MSKQPTDQQILGEHLVATISNKNYYTRTLNKMFVPRNNMKPMYSLTLDFDPKFSLYNISEKSFSITLDKESLKGLADFIYETIGEKGEDNE
ncbi:hypothetical protein EB118_19450 [bacterium]|nr:hypothetical protein [bacterium]NDC95961.1 hypothetical protein [bacterium]NDD85638.1 hypothetical protein [bacterium]NDG32239.1 hypothetical protein [bacterium]